ncbi:MAG: DegV family protein [Ruminococcaceae bacterium]|nr:DegV family protein [Oscillospiraceae bacterium]
MKKFVVMTDTNCGISPKEAEQKGIILVLMPFLVDDKEYFEFGELSYEQFFKKMAQGADVKTSQPSPADVISAFENALKTAEKVIYIPMSSALSSSCDTAQVLAEDFDGRVLVVDNKRISLNLRDAVEDALKCLDEGMDAESTVEYLNSTAELTDIYVAVNTLEYLKKSGRITPSGAAIGSLLGIKPVLRIHGGKLDAYKKVRGMAAAMTAMLEAVDTYKAENLCGEKIVIRAAYSGREEFGKQWQKTVGEYFGGIEIGLDPLPISISCHVGPDALGISISKIK